jgi:hypothetical protein
MSTLELTILIGIVTAFTRFAAVLAWVSRGDGGPNPRPNTLQANPAVKTRRSDQSAQIGHASSA